MTRTVQAFAGKRSHWDVDGVLLPVGRPVRATLRLKWRKLNPTLWSVEPAAGVELEVHHIRKKGRPVRWQGRMIFLKNAKVVCRYRRAGAHGCRLARIDAELLLWGFGRMLCDLSGHEAGLGPLDAEKWPAIVRAILKRQKSPPRRNLGPLTKFVVAEPGVVH